MNHIDILDYEIDINGKKLVFPMSYEEIKESLGEARIEDDRDFIAYIYDELGIVFEGTKGSMLWIKKEKGYKDAQHNIISVRVVTADNSRFSAHLPNNPYVGNVTFFEKQVENKYFNKFMGCYQAMFKKENGEFEKAHVGAYIYGDDKDPNYDGECLLKPISISYKPRRPKSQENYNIEQPSEPSLSFDNFNFKLAVINELMYEQEVLKPFFDIYDYMKFKKANWNLETEKNVRAAVQFFKDLPVPVTYAEKVTRIVMDGGDQIYQNIAPMWDGEDDRFDVDKLTETELKQFFNLKEMELMTKNSEKLKKICEPLGIEVRVL